MPRKPLPPIVAYTDLLQSCGSPWHKRVRAMRRRHARDAVFQRRADLIDEVYCVHRMRNADRCLVGVGVMVVHRGCVLVGVRRGSHCAGQLSFPGGHVDLADESLESCGAREVSEEVLDPRTGLGFAVRVQPMAPGRPQVFLRHDRMEWNKSFVTLFLKAVPEDPEGLDATGTMSPPPDERHKCDGWRWACFRDLCEHLLGKREATYADLASETGAASAWVPLGLIHRHADEIGLGVL